MECCGVICEECRYFPEDCPGCQTVMGKPFWTRVAEVTQCDIYRCCKQERGYAHCGKCEELPCARYNLVDPTRTEEENQMDFLRQQERLKNDRN